MAGSALLMYWAWRTDSYALRVAVGFTFIAEFSLVATCSALLRRLAVNGRASAAFVLSSLVLWEIVPAGALLLPLTVFFAPAAVPILAAIFLASWARYLIGEDRVLPGVLLLLLPVASVVALCLYRPWSPDSVIWPVVAAIYSAMLLIALGIAVSYIGHSRLGGVRGSAAG